MGFAKRFGTLILAAATIAGCGEKSAKEVYVLLPSSGNPFWQEVGRGAEAAKDSSGDVIRVLVRAGASDTDASQQVAVMRQVLDGGQVSALVVGPASATEIVPTVSLYNRARIPVVVIDSRLDESLLKASGARVDAFVGSQNEQGASLDARYLVELLGADPRRILILAGSPVHETARARSSGFRSALPTSWQVEERTANWSREEANRMARALAQGKLPDAVFAANDEMALGFIAGLKASNISQSSMPLIVGFDATPDGRQALVDGSLCATVAQDPLQMGRVGVELAVGLREGRLTPPVERLVDLTLIKSDNPRCARKGGQ